MGDRWHGLDRENTMIFFQRLVTNQSQLNQATTAPSAGPAASAPLQIAYNTSATNQSPHDGHASGEAVGQVPRPIPDATINNNGESSIGSASQDIPSSSSSAGTSHQAASPLSREQTGNITSAENVVPDGAPGAQHSFHATSSSHKDARRAGKIPLLKVNTGGSIIHDQHDNDKTFCSSPVDIIDPGKPRQSNRTPQPSEVALSNAFAPAPNKIEHWGQRSRSEKEALHRLNEFRGFNEMNSPSISPVGSDDGAAFLSTSFKPKKYGQHFPHMRTRTPSSELSDLSTVFGTGLHMSKYSTASTRPKSNLGGSTPFFSMSPTSSVVSSARSSLSHKSTFEEREAARQEKLAYMDRQILENRANEDSRRADFGTIDARLFSQAAENQSTVNEKINKDTATEPVNSLVTKTLNSSDTSLPSTATRSGISLSPQSSAGSSSTFIHSPQAISPIIHRRSLIAEGLKFAEEHGFKLPLLPDSAVVSASTTPVDLTPTSDMDTAVSPPSVLLTTPVLSKADGDGRTGVRRKKKTQTVRIAGEGTVVAQAQPALAQSQPVVAQTQARPVTSLALLTQGVQNLSISANTSQSTAAGSANKGSAFADKGKPKSEFPFGTSNTQRKFATNVDVNRPVTAKTPLDNSSSSEKFDKTKRTRRWTASKYRDIPQATEPRSVFLHNLPPYLRARKLPGFVWAGAIDRFEYDDQKPYAKVKFIDFEAARIFAEETANGIPHPDKPHLSVRVTISEEVEPISSRLRESVAKRGATRVVKIVGLPEDEGDAAQWELGEWGVKGKGDSALLEMRNLAEVKEYRVGARKVKVVEFHFLNMRDADDMYLEVVSHKRYQGCEISFVEDPCAHAWGYRKID